MKARKKCGLNFLFANHNSSVGAKQILYENLWREAYVDGRINQIEETFTSRVAFMIDVTPTEEQACRESLTIY